MVAQVIGAAITAGACRVLLPSGLVVWEWYAPRCLLSLLMDVACILIVKSARTFEPLLLPLPLYDKSARSPYVERMRPLS